MDSASFLWGVSATAAWVAGLCFLRFRRDSGERLFGFFGAAFWVLAASYVILAAWAITDEARPYAYVVRLIAFLIIIAGIVDKNRTRAR